MEDGEVTEVRDAINAWLKEKTPLSESLEEELLAKLGALARTESGSYTVTVEAAPSQKRPFKRLTFSFAAFPVSGPDDEIVHYLEWMFH